MKLAEGRGLILRKNEAMYGSNGWFRVTIGTREENQMFVDVVHEVFGKK